jgi:outer membrane immunogenic protein
MDISKLLSKCLGAVAVSGLLGGVVLAADMPLKALPPAPVPVCTWCGFYVGGNAGYVNARDNNFSCISRNSI